VEAPRSTLGVVDFSGEALGRLDPCDHPDIDKILTLQGAKKSNTDQILLLSYSYPLLMFEYGYGYRYCRM